MNQTWQGVIRLLVAVAEALYIFFAFSQFPSVIPKKVCMGFCVNSLRKMQQARLSWPLWRTCVAEY